MNLRESYAWTFLFLFSFQVLRLNAAAVRTKTTKNRKMNESVESVVSLLGRLEAWKYTTCDHEFLQRWNSKAINKSLAPLSHLHREQFSFIYNNSDNKSLMAHTFNAAKIAKIWFKTWNSSTQFWYCMNEMFCGHQGVSLKRNQKNHQWNVLLCCRRSNEWGMTTNHTLFCCNRISIGERIYWKNS